MRFTEVCRTHDGYTLYAPVPDSTHIDVVGGWHDASDYLQYSTTSANATYHLLAAYRDFPEVFKDEKLANGLDGTNKIADFLDEAKWGLSCHCRNIPAFPNRGRRSLYLLWVSACHDGRGHHQAG